jgi:hypothetical protein
VIDHYTKGFGWLATVLDKDQDLVGATSTGFWSIPPTRPPDRGFDHTIALDEGDKSMIIEPYCHPQRFKDEIEK